MAGDDTRISNGQGDYSSGVWVDSQNPDILYTVATRGVSIDRRRQDVHLRSRARPAAKTTARHLDRPDQRPAHALRRSIRAPAVTLDGGSTWSGYYQIPIAQVYHVSTDTRYPYWVLASQQDTGAVMTRSRSDQGRSSVIDWSPLPSSEFGTITADPLHPRLVYGVGYGARQGGSGLIKIDLTTGQWGNVAPNFGADASRYTAGRDFWKRFDTAFDPKAMYVGYNCLLVTRDGAQTWKAFSPDLTTPKGSRGAVRRRGQRRGVRARTARGSRERRDADAGSGGSARAWRAGAPDRSPTSRSRPSSKASSGPAAATGQIYQHDGRRPALEQRHQLHRRCRRTSNFATVEAGHTTSTRRTWSRTSRRRRGGGAGAPAAERALHLAHARRRQDLDARSSTACRATSAPAAGCNVIREDPKQKGLLFAGTETTVYVSFDDGDHWQSLRQNLPSTSIRDMVFHTDDHMNDLVIGTYGRGFWVLDDMSPLRDLAREGAGDRGRAGVSLQAGRRHPRAHELELGSADEPGDAARAEPAVRRDHLLPPEPAADAARSSCRSSTRRASWCARSPSTPPPPIADARPIRTTG